MFTQQDKHTMWKNNKKKQMAWVNVDLKRNGCLKLLWLFCAPQSPSVAHLSQLVSPLSIFISCGNSHARRPASQLPHNKLHCSSFMFRLAVLCRNHDRGDDILDWVMLFWQTNPCQTMWLSSQHAANIHSEQPGSLFSCWCGKRGRRSLFWEERKSCWDSKPWLHGK